MDEDQDEMMFETTDAVEPLEDRAQEGDQEEELFGLSNYVITKFGEASRSRRNDEDRMIMAYQNFRGIYGPDVQFREQEKSRAFVKLTKVKVLAAYGKLTDVMFSNGTFPITISAPKLPNGVATSATMMLNPAGQAIAEQKNANPTPKGFRFKESGEAVPVEVTQVDLEGRFGYLKDLIEPIQDRFYEGEGNSNDSVTFHPAEVAAKKMQKKIMGQLDESNADKHLRKVVFEAALFGTGVMKGPFTVNKEYPNWTVDEQGNSKYEPTVKTVPNFEHVPIWNFYPDPDADNMEEAEYVIQRHKMSATQLRQLKTRPFFRDNVIEDVISDGANYTREWWENEITDQEYDLDTNRWLVYEFWGYVNTEDLEEYGLKISKKLKKQPQLHANVWVCGGEIIRCALNPYKPAKIPYFAVPYEINPYSFFGIGVAENMADSQMLMNGFMRLAVDNAALSGNLVFEIDANNLVPGQDFLDVYPGKVFVREQGAPGQAIFATQYPNVSAQNMQMFEMARKIADEATGLPSYSHGDMSQSASLGRTSSGISMMMSAANDTIKSPIKNFDDYLLGPLGKACFAFNMQFDPDPEIKGNLEVKARGVESLMSGEVRSQRLMQFLGIVMNPVLAPFAKIPRLLEEVAKSLQLDPDEIVNNMNDAGVQAEILKQFAPAPQGSPDASGAPSTTPGVQSQPGAPAGAQAGDMTGAGGGTTGVGAAPVPGTPGFSGAPA